MREDLTLTSMSGKEILILTFHWLNTRSHIRFNSSANIKDKKGIT